MNRRWLLRILGLRVARPVEAMPGDLLVIRHGSGTWSRVVDHTEPTSWDASPLVDYSAGPAGWTRATLESPLPGDDAADEATVDRCVQHGRRLRRYYLAPNDRAYLAQNDDDPLRWELWCDAGVVHGAGMEDGALGLGVARADTPGRRNDFSMFHEEFERVQQMEGTWQLLEGGRVDGGFVCGRCNRHVLFSIATGEPWPECPCQAPKVLDGIGRWPRDPRCPPRCSYFVGPPTPALDALFVRIGLES